MSALVLLAAAAAISFAGQGTMPPDQRSPARLEFVSEHRVLIGAAYGLDAIDGQPRYFGQRAAAEIPPGQRTILYSCPNAPDTGNASSLTYTFKPGHLYELVCRGGKEAVIRQSDDC